MLGQQYPSPAEAIEWDMRQSTSSLELGVSGSHRRRHQFAANHPPSVEAQAFTRFLTVFPHESSSRVRHSSPTLIPIGARVAWQMSLSPLVGPHHSPHSIFRVSVMTLIPFGND